MGKLNDGYRIHNHLRIVKRLTINNKLQLNSVFAFQNKSQHNQNTTRTVAKLAIKLTAFQITLALSAFFAITVQLLLWRGPRSRIGSQEALQRKKQATSADGQEPGFPRRPSQHTKSPAPATAPAWSMSGLVVCGKKLYTNAGVTN